MGERQMAMNQYRSTTATLRSTVGSHDQMLIATPLTSGVVARIKQFRKSPLFADLAPSDLEPLAFGSHARIIGKRETLFRAGDSATTLYLIVDGRVKISARENGCDTLLDVVGPGEMIGEFGTLDTQAIHQGGAEALQQTSVLLIARREFRQFLLTNPSVTIRLVEMLGRRAEVLGKRISDSIHLGLEQRLAHKLLEIANWKPLASSSTSAVDIQLTQGEIASLLGVTRESVNKMLRQYTAEGIVSVVNGRTYVLRPDLLEQRVSG